MFPVEKALPVKYDPRVLLQMCVDWLRGIWKCSRIAALVSAPRHRQQRLCVWEGLRESSPQLQPARQPALREDRIQRTYNHIHGERHSNKWSVSGSVCAEEMRKRCRIMWWVFLLICPVWFDLCEIRRENKAKCAWLVHPDAERHLTHFCRIHMECVRLNHIQVSDAIWNELAAYEAIS